MRRVFMVGAIFLLLATSVAGQESGTLRYGDPLIFRNVRTWFHLHSRCSDGRSEIEELKPLAISNYFEAIFVTEHSDLIERHNQKKSSNCSFKEYRKRVKALNDESFLAFAEMEITVDPIVKKSFYHVNKISEIEDPYTYTTKYSHLRPEDFVSEVCQKENALCCVNHVKDAPDWKFKIKAFNCIELMNDFPGLFTSYDYEHQYNKNAYFLALMGGWKGFVVGGSDFHLKGQKIVSGENNPYMIATNIFPDEFTKDSMLSAMREGRTIATKNLILDSVNIYPTSKIWEVGDSSFTIEMTYRVPKIDGNPAVWIHKNGSLTKYRTIEASKDPSSEDDSKWNTYFLKFSTYHLRRTEEPTCFVVEIDHHLISSSYCFRNSPEEATIHRVTDISIGTNASNECWSHKNTDTGKIPTVPLRFSVENYDSALKHFYREICSEDFLRDPTGKIVGCRKPKMIIADATRGSSDIPRINVIENENLEKIETPIYTSAPCFYYQYQLPYPLGPETGWFINREDAQRCRSDMMAKRDVFVVPSDRKNFKCAFYKGRREKYLAPTQFRETSECYLITDFDTFYDRFGTTITRFDICDPKGSFSFSEEGVLEKCDVIDTGQLSYGGSTICELDLEVKSLDEAYKCALMCPILFAPDNIDFQYQDYFWLIKK